MSNEKLLDYFDGDEMSSNVWLSKYALKGEDGEPIEETPDDMHKRMAKYFAEVEERYEFSEKENIKLKLSSYGYGREQLTEDKIYELFKDFKYVVPGGSVMAGLGCGKPVSLSNCWVIDGPKDNLNDIFRVCNEQSQLFKRRGGVGFDISKLRPNGAKVHNAAKTTTGPVSFMELFSNVTNTIGQAGRRGALMISMHIDHPDSLEFIEKKQDLTKVTGANVSVQVGDDFMNAVISDSDYIQRWPIDTTDIERVDNEEYNKLYETKDGEDNVCYYKKVKARELWDKLVHCAWNTAEPGILFKDKHYNYSPDGVYPQFKGSSTNPCLVGETLIKTTEGDIAIKDIVNGISSGKEYKVLTYNEQTKELEEKSVLNGFLTKENANVIEVVTDEGNKIKMTPDHKVFTENRGWVNACELTNDDVIFSQINGVLKNSKVINKNDASNEDVYDLQVEDNHNFFANGILVHNCGEIFMHEDSCRLIHVNLSSFIENPFTDKARIDDDKLYEVFYETTRLGDDLVDLEADAIRNILHKIENDGDKGSEEYNLYERLLTNTLRGRRCGVGFFGLSDAIAKLGYKFDSDESLKAIEHMMKVMFIAELDSEIDMSVTRGSFKDFDASKEKDGNDWYEMVKRDFPKQYAKMMQYGRRNVSFGTAAPTGTVAMLAHCSSGIEPVFMPYYTRRVKCADKSDRVDFIDRDGEKFTEYVTVHPTMKEWAIAKYGDVADWNEKQWESAYKKSPWFGSTANDIDWIKRVEIQSIVQNRITHSISSCVVKDTLIQMENGGYCYIDELFDFSNTTPKKFYKNENIDELVVSHDKSCNKIESFYNNGKNDVFNLTLTNGLNIKCTSNERFLVFNEDTDSYEWKELSEISEGDKVKIS